jgi:serine phosphatase RsbU (regulator of sigma subunit)
MHAIDTTQVPGARSTPTAELHLPRSVAALDQVMASELSRLLPGTSFALLLPSQRGDSARVELCGGPDCPWRTGTELAAGSWRPPAARALSAHYREHEVGSLLVWPAPPPIAMDRLDELLQNYTVALVNLNLHEDVLRTADAYAAGLQAMEDGVALFQQTDPEAAGARLLGLMSGVLEASVAALYTLESIGDPCSPLALAQALGIPEPVLESLRTDAGVWWPGTRVSAQAGILSRTTNGGGLGDLRAPAALANIVTLPLRYHGVTCGLVLVFNVPETEGLDLRLSHAERLAQLGAALMHRFRLEELAVRDREIRTQLGIAGAIQRRLLPLEPPASPRLECAWQSNAAQFVGGDYVDLLTGPGGETLAVIADVSGHGIDSALLMSSFRSAYRAEAVRLAPGELLRALNREVVREVSDTGMFITAAVFRIEPDTRRVSWASAGHNPLFVRRAADGRVEEIDSTGPPMGFLDGAMFRDRTFELARGDVLLLYTDGIVEAHDTATGEMFGVDRLIACLREHGDEPAQRLLDALLADLTDFAPDHRAQDDVTAAVIQVR